MSGACPVYRLTRWSPVRYIWRDVAKVVKISVICEFQPEFDASEVAVV